MDPTDDHLMTQLSHCMIADAGVHGNILGEFHVSTAVQYIFLVYSDDP